MKGLLPNQFVTVSAASAVHLTGATTFPMMQLNLLSSYPNARCLDGSTAGYYFTPGHGSGGNKFYIDHQGGGWCETMERCLQRSTTTHGSSLDWPEEAEWRKSHLFSTSPDDNPLVYNWNKVYIRYCDGSSFTSNQQDPVEVDGVMLHMRGISILDAVMADLSTSDKGLATATDAIIGGCSAGGLSAILHCDRWTDHIKGHSPNAKVVCAPESGFFVDYRPLVSDRVTFFDLMGHTALLHNPVLPTNCVDNTEGMLFQCMFPEMIAQHLETPLFVMQSKYDDWARGAIEMADGDVGVANTLGDYALDVLIQSGISTNEANGGFIDSCTRHCNGFNVEIDGMKKAVALEVWYEGLLAGEERLFLQNNTYPCDDCCGSPVTIDIPECEQDDFGNWAFYLTDESKTNVSDWSSSSWYVQERSLESPPVTKDPFDERLEVRNTAKVSIANGTAVLTDTGELYVNSSTPEGFKDVEITVEFQYRQDGSVLPGSGLTIIGPTRYQGPGDDPCLARSYRAHIRRVDGQVAFQKEGSKNVFTTRSFGPFGGLLGSDLSEGWIGAKFIVQSLDDGSVKLELFIDLQNAQGWKLAYSLEDEPGQWLVTKDIPSECRVGWDSVVYGAGSYVGLYNFGSEDTQVAIRRFTVRNILRDMIPIGCGVPSSSPSAYPASSPSFSPTVSPSEDNSQASTKKMPPIGLLVVASILLSPMFA